MVPLLWLDRRAGTVMASAHKVGCGVTTARPEAVCVLKFRRRQHRFGQTRAKLYSAFPCVSKPMLDTSVTAPERPQWQERNDFYDQ
jgi:hypothetical protein